MSKIVLSVVVLGLGCFVLACASAKEEEQRKKEQLEENFKRKDELMAKRLPSVCRWGFVEFVTLT